MALCSVSQYGLLGLEPDAAPGPEESLSHTTTLDRLLVQSLAALHKKKGEVASDETADALDEAYMALLRLQQALPPS
jgi:hypothetical protein